MEHHKISKFLNDSEVSKFLTRKLAEVNIYHAVNILSTKI